MFYLAFCKHNPNGLPILKFSAKLSFCKETNGKGITCILSWTFVAWKTLNVPMGFEMHINHKITQMMIDIHIKDRINHATCRMIIKIEGKLYTSLQKVKHLNNEKAIIYQMQSDSGESLRSWNAARAICNKAKSHLLVVSDSAELSFLKFGVSALGNKLYYFYLYHANIIYIGLIFNKKVSTVTLCKVGSKCSYTGHLVFQL